MEIVSKEASKKNFWHSMALVGVIVLTLLFVASLSGVLPIVPYYALSIVVVLVQVGADIKFADEGDRLHVEVR